MRFRRFQFSLRTFFVVTTIVAVPCAMLSRKMERKRRDREIVKAIKEAGGEISFDYQRGPPDGPDWVFDAEPNGPEWLRRIFGDDFFSDVAGVSMRGTHVNDAWLPNLRDLSSVNYFDLTSNSITDAGLKTLGTLAQTKTLSLIETKITDAGLAHLKGMTQLKVLDVRDTKVTDAGIAEFKTVLPTCRIICDSSLDWPVGLERPGYVE